MRAARRHGANSEKRRPKRERRWLRCDQSGAAAVEFALIAPFLTLLLLGMIAYAIYFGAAHSVRQLAADAARTAISGLNANERQDLVKKFIAANAPSYSFIDPAKITYKVGDSAVDPNQFAISVSYDAQALPIWNIFPGVIMPSSTITSTTEIRIGGF